MVTKEELKLRSLTLAGSMELGTKAGQFLFLAPQTPVDLETGALITDLDDLPREVRQTFATGLFHIDKREGRALAQTWQVYSNLSRILSEHGSSLEQILRQRIYLRDMREVVSVEKVILSLISNHLPATTIVQIPSVGLNTEIAITVEVIALVPEPNGLVKESVHLPELDPITAPYPQATKAGQFLFFSAMSPVSPETGEVVTRLDELPAETNKYYQGRAISDGREAALRAQAWMVSDNLRRVLASQGASMADLLHLNQWYRVSLRDYTPVRQVRGDFFSRPEDLPGATALMVTDFGVSKNVLMQFDQIALVPPKGSSEYRKEVIRLPGQPALQPYGGAAQAVKAGPFIFTSGNVGIDQNTGKLISSSVDLADKGRTLSYGRLHKNMPIMAQTWHVCQFHKLLLESNGSSMANIVQQNAYLRDMSEYPAMERVAGLFHGGKVPPTVAIPIIEIGPFNTDDLRVEIEVIAVC